MDDDAFRRLSGRPVLVTGGAGFIGSHLAQRLLDLGADVRVIDDLSSGRREHVPAGAHFVEGCVTDAVAVGAAARDCAAIFHQAAMVSVPESVADPVECHRVNVQGTATVLEASRAAGVGRVVFASSAAVYGDEPRRPSREDDPVDAVSPYAASKATGEALCASWSRVYPVRAVALRYFNVYGPRQNPRAAYAAVIAAFTDILRRGERPVVFGDGRQTRDFVHVDDVVRANLLAATVEPAPIDAPVNVGTGRPVDLLEVLRHLASAFGVEVEPDFTDPRPGDVRHSQPDLERARRVLGYAPTIDFADGIRALVVG